MYQDYEDVLKAYYQARRDVLVLANELMFQRKSRRITEATVSDEQLELDMEYDRVYQQAKALRDKYIEGGHHA